MWRLKIAVAFVLFMLQVYAYESMPNFYILYCSILAFIEWLCSRTELMSSLTFPVLFIVIESHNIHGKFLFISWPFSLSNLFFWSIVPSGAHVEEILFFPLKCPFFSFFHVSMETLKA